MCPAAARARRQVTITDNGTTVTMANGIVAIVITKTSAEIDTINYTFNNTGSSRTLNLFPVAMAAPADICIGFKTAARSSPGRSPNPS